ncbi:Do family serine endopeptidase [Fretibacter rubidus]|uniref:Do family serine endopeptidase n=1 Tax=Fretibacter rubidus TaxID=570162 RepID=UPI00352B9F15
MTFLTRLFLAISLLFLPLSAAFAQTRGVPDGFAELAQRLSPAVVNISTAQTVEVDTNVGRFPEGSPLERFDDFFGGGDIGGRVSKSLGSGFVIDKDGYIVTNNHVIEGADIIEVSFPNEDVYTATLIGRDPATDIALLKIDAGKDMPFVPFGDASKAEVGDWVIAIGNPFGYNGSVAAGIVSARSRNINHGTYDDFIQTDVAINKGNSGGPLFNMAGEVIGVNTAILSPTGGSVGISFSVPADLTQSVVAQLREFGETRRGTLGVRVQAVDKNLAKSYGLDEAKGALITRVNDKGPAATGGLRRGDLIVGINGDDVVNSRALFRQVAELPIDEMATIDYIRKKKRRTAEVKIDRLKEKVRKADGTLEPQIEGDIEGVAMGVSVEALTREVRRKHRIKDDVVGVRVVKVAAKSEASGKIVPGDIIEEVGFEPVGSPEAFMDAVKSMEEGSSPVTILVNQNGNYKFYSLML